MKFLVVYEDYFIGKDPEPSGNQSFQIVDGDRMDLEKTIFDLDSITFDMDRILEDDEIIENVNEFLNQLNNTNEISTFLNSDGYPSEVKVNYDGDVMSQNYITIYKLDKMKRKDKEFLINGLKNKLEDLSLRVKEIKKVLSNLL